MSDYTVRLGGEVVEPATGWSFSWVDEIHGIARLYDGNRSSLVLVEGEGCDWVVTLRGRRIHVRVETWRERTLAAAEVEAPTHDGPLDIKATLPGLVVSIAAREGADVAEGEPLITIEAMKMQNEVRAPRAGRVGRVAVEAGQTVTPGALLLRME